MSRSASDSGSEARSISAATPLPPRGAKRDQKPVDHVHHRRPAAPGLSPRSARPWLAVALIVSAGSLAISPMRPRGRRPRRRSSPLTQRWSPAGPRRGRDRARPRRGGKGEVSARPSLRPCRRREGQPEGAESAAEADDETPRPSLSTRAVAEQHADRRAPLAARSERFTARSFQATSAGGSPGR